MFTVISIYIIIYAYYFAFIICLLFRFLQFVCDQKKSYFFNITKSTF